MLLLGIDFETTGLKPKEDHVTEVGMVLFHVETLQPVRLTGFLVKTDREIIPKITELTGINREMLDNFGVSSLAGVQSIRSYMNQAQWMVGHNAKEFDRLFLNEWAARENVTLPQLPWADSKTDLPKEAYGKSAGLKYMACDHGFLYDGHRAVNDVLAMFKIIQQHDINEFLRVASVPNVIVQALVSYDDRKLASERGYHWQDGSRMWTKPIKADKVEDEKKNAPFNIRIIASEGETPR